MLSSYLLTKLLRPLPFTPLVAPLVKNSLTYKALKLIKYPLFDILKSKRSSILLKAGPLQENEHRQISTYF